MNISSPAFNDNGFIPARYSRLGGNVSPPLIFEDVPPGVKSLVLVCHDPDAPRAQGWTHWVVWNIAPNAPGFKEGSVPDDVVQGTTDGGELAWSGPLPPSGTHRYIFYLYALDVVMELPVSTTRLELERAMQRHVVDNATLTGLFSA